MAGKLQQELKQTKPFRSKAEEVALNIVRTAEYLGSEVVALFREAELTSTQYNALRILRGAGGSGLSCGEISERMVTKESDITRLLDRLENAGLISRERPPTNRRMVLARITDAGLSVLEKLDQPLVEFHERLFAHMSEEKLALLSDLLEEMRSPE